MNYRNITILRNWITVISLAVVAMLSLFRLSPAPIAAFLPVVIILFCALSLWGNALLIDMVREIRRKGTEYIGLCSGGKSPFFLPGGINIFHRWLPEISIPALSADFTDRSFAFELLGSLDGAPKAAGSDIYILHLSLYPSSVILAGQRNYHRQLAFLGLWSAVYLLVMVAMLIIIVL